MTNKVTEPLQGDTPSPERPYYSLRQLVVYFLRLGALGFGGPVALVGFMHRDLVEQRHWISEGEYKEGLALSQLAPGPLAAQLGIYIGYVHYGIRGATLTGLAFVLPSFLMVLALGWLYTLYGGLSWMQAVFYGVGASVIAIVIHSAYRLTRRTIGADRLLWGIYLVAAAWTVLTETEQVLIFLAAGALVWLIKAPPDLRKVKNSATSFIGLPLFLPALQVAASSDGNTLLNILTFFATAGAFVFGSGLAIVPFLYGGVVNTYHWLTPHQFVDAVAVAMITPGPVVITVGFIGFLVAGFLGACVAALATFLPCYLFTVIGAPYFKRYGKRPAIAAFIQGVTAAAIGTIAGAVVVLGRRSIVDVPTLALCLVTLGLLWKVKRIPEPLIVLGAALVGLLIYPA
ncbi:MAG TPA: chromate transporter, partial [Aggregatilineales bacterium]|nr:chromate transporter [Aggregatilineales bacterium]